MRQRTHVVFDDYVSNAAGIAITDARYNTVLGEHDQIALHAVGDNAPVLTTVNVFVQHSSEGRQWLYRQNNSTSSGTPEIVIVLNGTTDVQHKMWSDACLGTNTAGPLLSFVRLVLSASAAGAAHVKVHLTQRGSAIG
jgi:hypothetical protein